MDTSESGLVAHINDRFLAELTADPDAGPRLVSGLRALLDQGMLDSDVVLIDLYERLATEDA